MSGKAVDRVLLHGPEDPALTLVLVAVASLARLDGTAPAPVRDVAALARTSQGSARRRLRQAVNDGWLDVVQPGNSRTPTVYRLVDNLLPEVDYGSRGADLQRANVVRKTNHKRATSGAQARQRRTENESQARQTPTQFGASTSYEDVDRTGRPSASRRPALSGDVDILAAAGIDVDAYLAAMLAEADECDTVGRAVKADLIRQEVTRQEREYQARLGLTNRDCP